MKKVSSPQVVTPAEASELPLPAEIQDALGELVGAARDGLLALSVGLGLTVVHQELYPEVVDACEEEGGVPSRLLKTEAGDGRQEGTPCQMFAGSPSGRTTRVGSRWMVWPGRALAG